MPPVYILLYIEGLPKLCYSNRALTIRRCLTSSLLSSFLLLTACSGTGDAFHGGWEETYSGGTGGPTVEEITSLANSDDVEAIVNLITMSNAAASAGGSGSAPEPSSVSIPGSDILQSLPPGTYKLKITMTVDGDVTTFESTADANGSFDFEIPPVPTDSEVSIRMDVRDDTGTLALTGRTGKTVSGDSDSLEVTLSSFFVISLTPPAGVDAWVWLAREDPSDPYGWVASSGEDSEYRISVSKEGSTVQLGGLAIKDGVVYEMPIRDITVGSDEAVALTMDTEKNFPGCGKLKTTTNGSPGAAYDRIMYETTDTSKKPDLLDWAAESGVFEVTPYAPEGISNRIFQYSSDGASWGTTYQYPDPSDPGNIWKASMNGVITPGWQIKMHYAVKINGTVVAEGDVIDTAE